MKKLIGLFPVAIFLFPIASMADGSVQDRLSSMNASIVSVKSLNHCGQGVIADLIKKYTRKLATNSEVSAARQLCSDVAADRVLLAKARTNHNHYLVGSYAYAINRGKSGDIAKLMHYMDHGGVIRHIYSHHYSNREDQFLTPYYIYSPKAIMDRYNRYEKHILKKDKLDAQLKAEE
jgi:hypothetical protein